MLTYLITLPSATTTLSEIGSYSSPWFEEFLPLAYLIMGIGIGIMIIKIIIDYFDNLTWKRKSKKYSDHIPRDAFPRGSFDD